MLFIQSFVRSFIYFSFLFIQSHWSKKQTKLNHNINISYNKTKQNGESLANIYILPMATLTGEVMMLGRHLSCE